MIEIVRAPAHLVVQDMGFTGRRKIGLPRAGAMDQAALEFGNALVGNAADDAGLEWAVSGGIMRFTCDVSIALTGAIAHGHLGQHPLVNDRTLDVAAGTILEIDRFLRGRFLYLSVSPPPDIARVFGSRSTYVPGNIGGYHGRRLKNGDALPIRNDAPGARPFPIARPDYSNSPVRIVAGPQSEALNGRLLSYLLASTFTISMTSDRTGYRLEGPAIDVFGLGQILSEPACEGAIQVTDSGTPIVLMADGPTIGGYNKVAVVISRDLPKLAQKLPGEKVRFALLSG